MPQRTEKRPKKWGMYEGTGSRAAEKKVAQLRGVQDQIRDGSIVVRGVSVRQAVRRLQTRIDAILAGTSR